MLYKPGDEVIVREDLQNGGQYYMADHFAGNYVTSEMYDQRGTVVTISRSHCDGYEVVGSQWTWTDDMFEGLVETEFHIDNLDSILNNLL